MYVCVLHRLLQQTRFICFELERCGGRLRNRWHLDPPVPHSPHPSQHLRRYACSPVCVCNMCHTCSLTMLRPGHAHSRALSARAESPPDTIVPRPPPCLSPQCPRPDAHRTTRHIVPNALSIHHGRFSIIATATAATVIITATPTASIHLLAAAPISAATLAAPAASASTAAAVSAATDSMHTVTVFVDDPSVPIIPYHLQRKDPGKPSRLPPSPMTPIRLKPYPRISMLCHIFPPHSP